jgi:hypothetical protein
MAISTENLESWYSDLDTDAVEIRSVKIGCPDCDYTVVISVFDRGLRDTHYCRNLECDRGDFGVTKDSIKEFHLNHRVSFGKTDK